MDKHAAIAIFESLSSGIRLDVFRLLVKTGADGVVAGEIATTLDLPPTNLSFHLKAMTHAGLLTVEQEGRFQRYRAHIPLMIEMIAYLTEECCSAQSTLCGELADLQAACPQCSEPAPEAGGMRPLPIVWQRLVSADGNTCPRCQGTQQEVQRAVARLRHALEPLGLMPALTVGALDQASFEGNPSESNRIWIAGRPMEEWVGGQVGSSQCCNECGDSTCRTVEVDGTTYEIIPEQLLVRAGLIAAAAMLDPSAPNHS